MNTPADIQAVIDRARNAAVQVLATIPDHSTGAAAQAANSTDRAIAMLQDAMLIAAYEAERQRSVRAAREARAAVDASLPTATKTKTRK